MLPFLKILKEACVLYHDAIYGIWDLPAIIEELTHTMESERIRKISQASAPAYLLPYNIPSRFQHGMGVCFLASKVLEANPELKKNYGILFLVAALLHDAGNPPFSHLAERFLIDAMGKDGESFLENIISGSETEKVLQKYRIKIEEVLGWVTGKTRPIAEVLNGSLDIDNLDNVGRFNQIACLGAPRFDAQKIATSFKFIDGRWVLLEKSWREVQKWKKCRKRVYKAIYDYPHLNATIMLYRALEIAFADDEIENSFFALDDYEAIKYLLGRNIKTTWLVDRVLRWKWYEEIYSFQSTKPSQKFLKLTESSWRGRYRLANSICEATDLPLHKICVYAGLGKDVKKVTLPFLRKEKEEIFYDTNDSPPVYRIKVYAPHELQTRKKQQIKKAVLDELA